jgi:outer membrane protein assembly factor BamB
VEVAAGRAVVTVSGGTLIGVDLGSGRPLWAAALPDVASGRVKRFDAAEAARLTGPRLVSWWGGLMQPPAEPRRGVHGPVGPGYGAPNSLITYAVDLGSGTVVWARPVWPLRERRIAPAGSSGGQVKYGVEPQAHGTFLLTAFRREDGGVVWETPVAEPLQTDYVWITEDAIAFVESSTAGPALTVRCLDGKRGRELWRIEGFERLLDRLLSGVHTAA